jgi:hypothetical protein
LRRRRKIKKAEPMIPYRWPVQTTVPQTLAKRLEVMEAIRALIASDEDERPPQRHADIVAYLARYHLPAGTAVETFSESMRAMIMFMMRKNFVLSNVHSGATISGIEQTSDRQGGLHCTVRFEPESFIQISAQDIAGFQF